MPRKAKGVENEIKTNQEPEKNVNLSVSSSKKTSKTSSSVDKKTSTSKKGATKSADTKSKATKKTTTTKKTATKKSTTSKKSSLESKKDTTATKKATAKKATTTATKTTTAKGKKETSSSGRAMLAPTKKETAKKTAAKKKTGTVASTERRGRRSLQVIPTNDAPTSKEILEYYDLPYRYNETTVKILAQTPKKLFIYWDISDNDRKNYVEKFGDEFFNNTVPVLIVHNASQNYTFEVEINDFANCWYLDITDAKCEYNIELGRRSKNQHFSIPNNYIYVTSSNVIESPNDHILFEKQTKTVYFRNVKTNATHSKDIANISFIRNMGKIYNIYDAYKKLYNKMYSDEDIIDINNPSSSNPTSTFK